MAAFILRILPLTLLLSACTAASVYRSPVDETATIARPLVEVDRCMQLQVGAPPITTPDGKTTFVLKNSDDGVQGLISLSAVAGGTRVEIRRISAVVPTGFWRNCR